jgi:hypothetical protein
MQHQTFEEQQYLDWVRHILDYGIERPDRTGVCTLSLLLVFRLTGLYTMEHCRYSQPSVCFGEGSQKSCYGSSLDRQTPKILVKRVTYHCGRYRIL